MSLGGRFFLSLLCLLLYMGMLFLTHGIVVPKRVEEAIRNLRYVDYSLLSRSARERAPREDDGLFLTEGGRVEIRGKMMSLDDEKDMSEVEWLVASEMVVNKTREIHGDARADPLAQHHRNVLELANTYSWAAARIYDKRTRELMAGDSRHDPTGVDIPLVQQSVIQHATQKFQASMLEQLPQQRPPSYRTSSFASSSSASSDIPSAKRFTPYDQKGRRDKASRPNPKCFRCGAHGHTAGSCSSSSTSAGFPCAVWSQRPGKSGGSLVDGSSGDNFCFRWQLDSSCRFAKQCTYLHQCSICRSQDHGAHACTK